MASHEDAAGRPKIGPKRKYEAADISKVKSMVSCVYIVNGC